MSVNVVRDIFRFRAKEFFRNPDCVPAGFMGDIVRLLKKYDLHSYFSRCINGDLFSSYAPGKVLLIERSVNMIKRKYSYMLLNLSPLPLHKAGTFEILPVNLNDQSECRLLLGGLIFPLLKVIKETGRMLPIQCSK